MRPVHRGDVPKVGKADKVYKQYRNAIGDLEKRLGLYCSYCERRFPAAMEVEHVSPKSKNKLGLNDWSNFLLACKTCNTVKGTKITNQYDFLWPDRDNTYLAFEYMAGGFVRVAGTLTSDLAAKSKNLCDLVGLDRHKTAGSPKPSKRDERYSQREEVWKLAEVYRAKLPQPSREEAETIADLAYFSGFFSVWMTVFDSIPLVASAIVARFPSTVKALCFDIDGRPVARPGGKL